jgi:TonB family protein
MEVQTVIQNGSPIVVFGKATFMFDLKDAAQRANGVRGEIVGGMDVPKSTRVSGAVMEQLLLKKVDPVYPEEAKRNHVRGAVVLAVTIDREGSVIAVQPVSGPPELVPAAVEALKQRRYKPLLMWGRPLEAHTQIQIDFRK